MIPLANLLLGLLPSLLLLSTASAAPTSPECAFRRLTYKYALQQTPTRAPLLAVFDGLELASLCGDARPAAPTQKPEGDWPSAFPAPAAAAAARTFYVDPSSKGSDGNAGTLGAPFATVARALAATRKARGLGVAADTAADTASAATGTSLKPTILLRAGVHYLTSTLALDARDAGLTVRIEDLDLVLSAASVHCFVTIAPNVDVRCS
jgi:hypothetical protein